MDAFFAAIEQQDHPQWLGKPVVVGADPKGGKGRGVVSTCSYEARAYGIRSAMPISKAYRLCPTAVYVLPRGHRYAEVSRQIMSLLREFSPDIEQISIDEAFVDITSTQKLFGGAEKMAKEIKSKIYEKTKLTASIGIAPNKFVAKIASDLRKPDGLVIVSAEEMPSFLAPLEISRLWGVGLKTVPQLQAMGIYTIGDLARYSQQQLIERLGSIGAHFWRLANGIDDRPVAETDMVKSISRETTFPEDVEDAAQLRDCLLYLCDDLSYEMRRKRLKGRTITLKIRLEDFSTFTRSQSLGHTTDICEEMFRCVEKMFNNFDRGGKRVRLLGVAMSQLQGSEVQLELFAEEDEKRTKLDRVMDQVRQKFGSDAIQRAGLLHKKHDSDWIRER